MDTQTQPVAPVTPPATPPAPAPQSAGHNHTLMGVLAYLGILVIVPWMMAKNDPFVKFHVQQGLVLLIIEAALWLFGGMFWGLWYVIQIIHFATIILSIIGIVNVVQKQEKELPLVGSFAKSLKI